MTPSRLVSVLVFAAWPWASACTPEPPPLPPPPPPQVVSSVPTTAPPSADATFTTLTNDFLDGYLALEPVFATTLGDHRHDDRWPDESAAGTARLRAFLVEQRARVAATPIASMNLQNQVDARILLDQIDGQLFSLDELKPEENNPVLYTTLVGDGLDPLLTHTFAPIEERLHSVRARLVGIPALVTDAKARLGHPPRVHTETAIEQVKGLVALCDHGIFDAAAAAPALRADVDAPAKAAAAALTDFQTFLEHDILPRSTGSFRAGPERFTKVLRYALHDDVSPDQLVLDARAEMDRTLSEMVLVARELWPRLERGPVPATHTKAEERSLVRTVLTRLADDATDSNTILQDATTTLTDATRFVADHDLVGVPSDPCRVIEMPEYRRGVTIAYCDSTGPLEKTPETVYAIAPAPSSWPAKRAASFYREYNHSMLVDLTVHEAMPGHYLQAMHRSSFRSPVRAIFEDGAFVEGWAVYGEWLMAKYGFGGAKTHMQRLKMLLRVAANTLLDHGIHAGQMTEKEAVTLMTTEAFQEEGEAVGKWRRARLSSGQLSTYFYGYREMRKLRAACETQPGFTERSYHDRLLSFGSPPMREVGALLGR